MLLTLKQIIRKNFDVHVTLSLILCSKLLNLHFQKFHNNKFRH